MNAVDPQAWLTQALERLANGWPSSRNRRPHAVELRCLNGPSLSLTLFGQGISGYEPLRKNRRKQLDELHTGDGRPLPTHLKTQISRELDRLELLLEQITAVENERDTLLAVQKDSVAATLIPTGAMLCEVKGIGLEFAAVLWTEGLFRHFDNRRQVAAYAGLAPTPWQSGTIDHEQGVSKAGNPRLRTTMIQLSWLWLRHQPQSALSRVVYGPRAIQRWAREEERDRGAGTQIVGCSMEIVIAGVVIEGAVLKTA